MRTTTTILMERKFIMVKNFRCLLTHTFLLQLAPPAQAKEVRENLLVVSERHHRFLKPPKPPPKKTTPARKTTHKKSQRPPESLIGAFKDPGFVATIVPVLQTMIALTIQAAIEKAVDSAVEILRSTVLNITGSNSQLKNTIDQQIKLSEQQNKIIKKQAKQLQEKSQKIAELEKKIENMSTELTKVTSSLNDVEQYGLCNSLRFSNLGLDPKLPEIELTKRVTTFINDRMLVNGPILSESDIERCHPIGRPRNNSPSQIIVKFSSYHTKNRVFDAKSRLRNSRMFASEDLTRMNYSLVKKLLPLKKACIIYSFWTSNGRISAKKSENGNPIRIYQADDIEHRLS